MVSSETFNCRLSWIEKKGSNDNSELVTPTNTKYIRWNVQKNAVSELPLRQRRYKEVINVVKNKSELEKAISTFFTPQLQAIDENLNKDSKLFEASWEKTNHLCAFQKSLLLIQPTSTDFERAFLIAGIFKTKVRNKLTPIKLNWLKNNFKKPSSHLFMWCPLKEQLQIKCKNELEKKISMLLGSRSVNR